MTTEERWVPVPGYEGLYDVSDLGAIRSIDRVITTNGRTWRKNGKIHRNGRCVSLRDHDGVLTKWRPSDLMMLAFVGPKPDGMWVYRIDGNKPPVLSNLEYRRCASHVKGKPSRTTKLTEEAVKDIRTRYAARESNQVQLANEYGVTRQAIQQVVHRQTWAHVD